jgi:hypothetical protein
MTEKVAYAPARVPSRVLTNPQNTPKSAAATPVINRRGTPTPVSTAVANPNINGPHQPSAATLSPRRDTQTGRSS